MWQKWKIQYMCRCLLCNLVQRWQRKQKLNCSEGLGLDETRGQHIQVVSMLVIAIATFFSSSLLSEHLIQRDISSEILLNFSFIR